METIKSSCLEKPPRRLTLLLAVSLGLASGCAQIPRLDPPPSIRKVDELGSSSSFAVPAAAWPSDHWWEVYGDPQLNALIDEALKNAPDLDLAQARLKAAAAQVQGAGATRLPEVTASAVVAEAKQSYDFLVPRQALPNGWNGYGAATLNMSYELDFWGKNRAALAAAVSEQHAAEVEIAQTRLILSTSVASAYAGLLHLYTLRDNAADTLALRMQTVTLFRQRCQFGLETLASVRQVEARQAAAKGDLVAIDERIGLQSNAIAALLGAALIGAFKSLVRKSPGQVLKGCLRICPSSFWGVVPTSSPRACVRKPPRTALISARRGSTRASTCLRLQASSRSASITSSSRPHSPVPLVPRFHCRSLTPLASRASTRAHARSMTPPSPPTTERSRRRCARWPMQPRAASPSMRNSPPPGPPSPLRQTHTKWSAPDTRERSPRISTSCRRKTR